MLFSRRVSSLSGRDFIDLMALLKHTSQKNASSDLPHFKLDLLLTHMLLIRIFPTKGYPSVVRQGLYKRG